MKKDLRDLFGAFQDKLACSLGAARIFDHPTAKGDASEFDWTGMLCDYLPERYSAKKAFVVDCEGKASEQLDIVIFDRFYSSILFSHHGGLYIPAESVYAVFEVKQDLSKKDLDYAAQKASSVRRLKRTSAPLIFAGKKTKPTIPFPPLAGLLTFGSVWTRDLHKNLFNTLKSHKPEGRLDLGCALTSCAFEFTFKGTGTPASGDLQIIQQKMSLAFFFLTLLQRLRELGTVPAIDWRRYLEAAIQQP
jgi:uncharacterized protein DUF6602